MPLIQGRVPLLCQSKRGPEIFGVLSVRYHFEDAQREINVLSFVLFSIPEKEIRFSIQGTVFLDTVNCFAFLLTYILGHGQACTVTF